MTITALKVHQGRSSEPPLQFSQTGAHFIQNDKMNPVKSSNLKKYLKPGVCG